MALAARKWQKWGEDRGYLELALAARKIAGMVAGEGQPRAAVSCPNMAEVRGGGEAAGSCRELPENERKYEGLSRVARK